MSPVCRAHRSPNRRGVAVAPKIKKGMETKTLRFQCKNTGLEVDSGISAHYGTRLISIRVRCPICEKSHEWQVADSGLGSVRSTDPRSRGARMARAQSTLQDLQGSSLKGQSAEIVELREQLLDELNHRLKNNLQILHGLLQTAYRRTRNSVAREVLSDTSRRIGAMGTAQQVFYSVRNSTDVGMHDFLDAVCANARVFFSKDISINYEATAGSLPKETALPLALALNELLTNAAKHGADDRGKITINVGLSQGSGEIELYVQDRGYGFDFEKVQGRSSGLRLVAKLAHRLNGTFMVERNSGARCTLRFPDQ
jgi:two-component sensor histidine kinase